MPRAPFPFSRLLPGLLVLLLWTGCATLPAMKAGRPEALEPIPTAVPPDAVYEEALTMAFDRGYHLLYTNDEDHLIELESLVSRLFFGDRLRRIDLFIREREGRTFIHARYHSYDLSSPADLDVTEEDRQAAQRFVEALLDRLAGRRHP